MFTDIGELDHVLGLFDRGDLDFQFLKGQAEKGLQSTSSELTASTTCLERE